VGNAAQVVMDICDELATVNPTSIPAQYLGDKQNYHKAPLDGTWKLLFSNAADAIFTKNSKRGAAKIRNVVDARRGRITNIIDFEPIDITTTPTTTTTTTTINKQDDDDDEQAKKKRQQKEPTLKQLNVIIKAKAVNDRRVELDFRYAKIVLTRLLGLPLFGRTLTLYIPVPATFITKTINLLQRVARFIRLSKQEEPRTTKGYFDVLYLDHQLRVHKTGQGNLFVQAKEDWKEAIPYLR